MISSSQWRRKATRANRTLKQKTTFRTPNKLRNIPSLQNDRQVTERTRRKVRRKFPQTQIKDLNKLQLWDFSRRNDGGQSQDTFLSTEEQQALLLTSCNDLSVKLTLSWHKSHGHSQQHTIETQNTWTWMTNQRNITGCEYMSYLINIDGKGN